jgi:hypothetical protein
VSFTAWLIFPIYSFIKSAYNTIKVQYFYWIFVNHMLLVPRLVFNPYNTYVMFPFSLCRKLPWRCSNKDRNMLGNNKHVVDGNSIKAIYFDGSLRWLRRYHLDAFFVIQVDLGSKFCPLSETVQLWTPVRYIRDFSVLNVLSFTKIVLLLDALLLIMLFVWTLTYSKPNNHILYWYFLNIKQ